MNLAALLVELKALLNEPEKNLATILDRLEDHEGLAEFEVARFFVQKSIGPLTEGLSRSPDPRLRSLAASAARCAIPRAKIPAIARRLAKDPDSRVRSRIGAMILRLGLRDVTLPDPRAAPRLEQDFYAYRWAKDNGAWRPGGWIFGVGSYTNSKIRKVRARVNPKAVAIAVLSAKLKTPLALARWLGLKSVAELARFTRPGTGPGAGYVSFSIPKRSGGERAISAPRPRLRALQRKVLREILDPLPTHPCAHGFVRGRSVLSNATPHTGAALVVKLDLEDYFPTVHARRVQGFFASLGLSGEVAWWLARLCTHRSTLADGFVVWPGALPQGAPSSPSLANHISGRLDARLRGLGLRVSATYTRYADDLTFSFKTDPGARLGRFLWWVDQIVQQEGFTENVPKRRVLRAHAQQRVTGVVVNQAAHVPREAKRRFRAILNNCRTHGMASQARGRLDFGAYLRGFASWVAMVEPALGAKFMAEVLEILRADRSSAA